VKKTYQMCENVTKLSLYQNMLHFSKHVFTTLGIIYDYYFLLFH